MDRPEFKNEWLKPWRNRFFGSLSVAVTMALTATYTPAVADSRISIPSTRSEVVMDDHENIEDPCGDSTWGEYCDPEWDTPIEMVKEPLFPSPNSVFAGTSFKPDLGTWRGVGNIQIGWVLDGEQFDFTYWDEYDKDSPISNVEVPVDAFGQHLTALLHVQGRYHGEEHLSYDLGKVQAKKFDSSSAPKITGNAFVGQTLGISLSSWSPTAGYKYQWKRNGKEISKATGSSYRLTNEDSNTSISVTVTGSRAGFEPVTYTSPSVKVVNARFSSTPVPTVSGTATVGKALTAKAGTWSPSATLKYQWKRDGKNISGATRSTYTLIGADAGRNISVTVTGSKANYASVAKTSKSLKIKVGAFSKSSVPSISGSAKVGSKLTAKTGTWSPKASFGYQWYRGNAKIKGATKSTYTPVAADNGKFLKVSVTGKSQGYKDVTKTSKTKKITTGTITPSSKLKISGNAQYGKTISASVKLPSGTKSTYQWYKNGKKIKGATKKSYKLGAKDIGAKYQVRMTVTKAGFKKLDLSSNTVKVGKATFSVKANPTVSGSRKSGSTLKATGGSFAPSPSTRSYQWLRNGKAIKGATRSSYKLTNSDSGTKISVQVTANKANYTSKSAKSSSVDIARILKTVISKDGTYKVGSKLKPGLYKATGSGNSCYWERLNGFSGSLDDINSNYIGTANTYVRITSYDEGFKTSRCGSWKQVSSSGAKATTIKKNGTYRVGIDIKPGLYKGISSDSCYWETLYDFTGDFYDIIENDFSYDRYIYVDIPSDAKGFKKNGCGTLKRIG